MPDAQRACAAERQPCHWRIACQMTIFEPQATGAAHASESFAGHPEHAILKVVILQNEPHRFEGGENLDEGASAV